MRRRYQRYNRTFFVGAVLLLLGNVLFNGLVDPFSIYPDQALTSLERYRKIGPSRITIAESLIRVNPEVLLLGTSRTKNGLRTDHAAFEGRRCFNAGLPAGSMEELRHVARVAMDQTDVKEIVFFADFFSFNDRRLPIAGFDSSRFSPTFNVLEFHLEQLLSFTAFSRSKKVLWRWRSGTDAQNEKIINRKVIARELLAFHDDPMLYGEFNSSAASWRELAALKKMAHDNNVNLKVILLPVHATMLETLRHAGLWDKWEQWKRQLIVELGPTISVWDFQYYGEYTAHPVGEAGDMVQAMVWFKDPSHALPKFCSLVLDRVYTSKEPAAGGGFGRKLNEAMIESWLVEIREKRARYAENYPQDILWIEKILALKD
ncbi:MAG: hypothetical protein ACI97A_002035 [Planctomycetota bacterium]|jgi:hypothetical protein